MILLSCYFIVLLHVTHITADMLVIAAVTDKLVNFVIADILVIVVFIVMLVTASFTLSFLQIIGDFFLVQCYSYCSRMIMF